MIPEHVPAPFAHCLVFSSPQLRMGQGLATLDCVTLTADTGGVFFLEERETFKSPCW